MRDTRSCENRENIPSQSHHYLSDIMHSNEIHETLNSSITLKISIIYPKKIDKNKEKIVVIKIFLNQLFSKSSTSNLRWKRSNPCMMIGK